MVSTLARKCNLVQGQNARRSCADLAQNADWHKRAIVQICNQMQICTGNKREKGTCRFARECRFAQKGNTWMDMCRFARKCRFAQKGNTWTDMCRFATICKIAQQADKLTCANCRRLPQPCQPRQGSL